MVINAKKWDQTNSWNTDSSAQLEVKNSLVLFTSRRHQEMKFKQLDIFYSFEVKKGQVEKQQKLTQKLILFSAK